MTATLLTTAGDWDGEAIVASPSSGGTCYYLASSGTWTATNANSHTTSSNLLGLGIGGNILIRGFYKSSGSFTVGAPIYLTASSGGLSSTAPTTSGHIIRVVGYAYTSSIIYFDPSRDWFAIL
jgi:hypothetical protein